MLFAFCIKRDRFATLNGSSLCVPCWHAVKSLILNKAPVLERVLDMRQRPGKERPFLHVWFLSFGLGAIRQKDC